jgi:hypothetical protein
MGMNNHLTPNNRVDWFVKWIDSRDQSKFKDGRLIVNLLCGHRRLDRIKSLALELVKICDDREITVLFHVIDPCAAPHFYDERIFTANKNSIIDYTLCEYYGDIEHPNRKLRLNHKVILRRMYLQDAKIIDDLWKVDLLISDYIPDLSPWDDEKEYQALYNNFYHTLSDALLPYGLLINFIYTHSQSTQKISSPKKLLDNFHQFHPITPFIDQFMSDDESSYYGYYDVWFPKVT